MSNSPWGQIQNSKQMLRGMRFVSTASHGGIMVTKKFALKNLSVNARNRGLEYGNYLCYEEDCDYAIPMYECRHSLESTWEDKETEVKSLLNSLSMWNAEYLLELGITPLEPAYTQYKEIKLRDKLAEEHSPDLIICAWGTWDTNIPGVIRIATADGKQYHIAQKGYSDMKLKLLSKCEIIKELI